MRIEKGIFLCIFVFLYAAAYTQEAGAPTQGVAITTVAVVDINLIYSSFPTESQGYRYLSSLKSQFQKEIDDFVAQLDALKRQRHRALQDQQYVQAEKYEEQIANLARYIDSLSEQRQSELTSLSRQPVSGEFLQRLQEAIEFVAQENGYTVVLHANAEGLQWWAPVVDISQKVIERLRTD